MRRFLIKRIAPIFLIGIMLLQSGASAGAATLAERLKYHDSADVADILFDTYYYSDYLKDRSIETSNNGDIIKIDLTAYQSAGASPEIRQDNEKGQVLYWDEGCEFITYEINAPNDNMYEIYIDYYAVDGNLQNISRGIEIDGEYPFEEAKNIFLRRSFKDSEKPKENNLGDEVMPSQIETKRWSETAIYDNNGMYSNPLTFALSAGAHTITFNYINQPVLIAGIYLKSPNSIPTYSNIKSTYKDTYNTSNLKGTRFEAEDYESVLYKSASSILIGSDSDSTMTPKAIVEKRYNFIGGSTWCTGGDSITWKFNIEEDGLYKMAFRSVQNANSGMPSTRKIEIDNKVPFAEMENYVFEYDAKWQTNVLKYNDEPYLFYLEKGEHTLTLTAQNGSMTEIIHKVSEANSKLSNCYQNIVMITGQLPDVNYDYELVKAMPALVDRLDEIIGILHDCISELKAITNKTATLENSILQASSTINAYKNNTDSIPTGLADFTSILTNMGDWITTLQTQYFAIDYIEIASPDSSLQNPSQSLWDRIAGTFRNLILSYIKDYNEIGSEKGNEATTERELEVWISKSKEWAEVLKSLADSNFAIKNNVNLSVNLLPEGAFSSVVNTLLLAVNAGNEPDIVLNMTPTNTAEYAVRGAIYDLSEFKDFQQYSEYTLKELFKPVSYNGGVYGLPETMDFRVLIYRNDIFEKLHIDVPNTWNDVYNVMLPKLYQYNLQMYIPVNYSIFLFQNGGKYYTDDGNYTALNSDGAYKAFEQMIGNYNDYGFPYSANFFNRFRTGEIPVGIGGLSDYLSIAYGAPELVGKWRVAQIPATIAEDSSENRSVGEVLTTVSAIMQSTKNPELAWEFLKWWESSDTQSEYGRRLESTLGISARWTTTNIEAFKTLPWSTSDLKVISESWKWVRETPYVPGGYFTTRHITNAVARCITGDYTPRSSLEDTVEQINVELQRKREDFGINE